VTTALIMLPIIDALAKNVQTSKQVAFSMYDCDRERRRGRRKEACKILGYRPVIRSLLNLD
jgi:hypothetical protein